MERRRRRRLVRQSETDDNVPSSLRRPLALIPRVSKQGAGGSMRRGSTSQTHAQTHADVEFI